MDLDDLPKKQTDMVIGESLERLSIAELEQRIQALESEIARVKAAISAKQATKSAVDAFFRS